MSAPRWLAHAWTALGQREWAGEKNNPKITAFFRDVGQHKHARDAVPWCAAFVGGCLERTGIRSTRSLLARSYLNWGQTAESDALGAIAVLSRGRDPGKGHVGFLVGSSDKKIWLLGGNQSDAVTIQAFSRTRLLSLRWPSTTRRIPHSSDAVFSRALAHVLKMEGGYTDDPVDPGGPTNKGITLAVFAAWEKKKLTSRTRPGLMRALKKIPDTTVSTIYHTRYWRPAHCPELEPPLALMHFDAAVNHGVGAAVRMLQQAVATDVDGEIGPNTRRAIMNQPIERTLGKYADIRRKKYRRLHHFWRFGRGWLRRVDLTLDAARVLFDMIAPDEIQNTSSKTSRGNNTMANSRKNASEPKWWGQSVTIWGALISALATVLPAFGPLIGIDLTADLVRQVGDEVVKVAQAIAGLAGVLLTIYGRTRATQPLIRRDISVRI